jgi:hypothetical protein
LNSQGNTFTHSLHSPFRLAMSSRRRKVANVRRSRGARLPSSGPSQLKTNLEVRHQYRFLSSSGAATSIYASDLLTASGVCATTAILGKALFFTVKVNQIEIWSPPAAQGAAVTCGVLFPASNNSPSREVTDTSVSVATPAHVLAQPLPLSLSAFWQNGGSAADPNMFTLTAPSGSIIDVWLSLVLNDGSPVDVDNTATLVGATVGSVYYCSLDSSISAGSVYKPIGLTTL